MWIYGVTWPLDPSWYNGRPPNAPLEKKGADWKGQEPNCKCCLCFLRPRTVLSSTTSFVLGICRRFFSQAIVALRKIVVQQPMSNRSLLPSLPDRGFPQGLPVWNHRQIESKCSWKCSGIQLMLVVVYPCLSQYIPRVSTLKCQGYEFSEALDRPPNTISFELAHERGA